MGIKLPLINTLRKNKVKIGQKTRSKLKKRNIGYLPIKDAGRHNFFSRNK